MTAPRSRRADELGDEQRIAEIRARAEAATPGPWVLDEQFPRRVYCDDTLGSCVADCNMSHAMILTREDMGRNAEFVAGARDDVPYLLDLVQSLRTQLAEADSKLAEARRDTERLDFLSSDNNATLGPTLHKATGNFGALVQVNGARAWGFTLREAIDAARSPSPETEG